MEKTENQCRAIGILFSCGAFHMEFYAATKDDSINVNRYQQNWEEVPSVLPFVVICASLLWETVTRGSKYGHLKNNLATMADNY